MDGNVEIFDGPNVSDDEHLFRKTSEDKNNILHIAVRYEQTAFVKAFLKKYMGRNKKLITERNSHGNTPLHVAVETTETISGIVQVVCHYLKKSEEEKPLRAQNSEGNTALHLALLSNNYHVAKYLVEKDGGLARIVNHSLEAPLHLAITHLDSAWVSVSNSRCDKITRLLLEKARSVASWRDAKGLTPLLRAASHRHPFDIVQVTKTFIDICPESTLVCDDSGNSFLHLLMLNNNLFDVHQDEMDKINKVKLEMIEELICLKEIRILKDHKNKIGNTPSHIAAKCNNIHMVTSLRSKCSPNWSIKNNDGMSAQSIIRQQGLWNQPRSMTPKEVLFAKKGDIDSLNQSAQTIGLFEFSRSQDSATGSNFLHLLMNTTAIHHVFSSSDDRSQFMNFINRSLFICRKFLCDVDKSGDTPIHILVRNKDCRSMENPPTTSLWESGLLSQLLSTCAGYVGNEASNLVWVRQNDNGNTPLHEAVIAKNKVLVLQLLSYSKKSAQLVNKNKETPLHLLAGIPIGKGENTDEEIMKMVNANIDALRLLDNDGRTPISRAIKAENLQIVVTLLHSVQKLGDTDRQTSWLSILDHPSIDFFNGLIQLEAFRNMLQQKGKIGNTLLHLAIKENCFVCVHVLLKHESFKDSQDLLKLLSIPNNVGETPEDLLADLTNIEKNVSSSVTLSLVQQCNIL